MHRSIGLIKALRAGPEPRIAVVGAGGKTTLLFRLAREFSSPVIVTTTAHLSAAQADLADRHKILKDEVDLEQFIAEGAAGVTLLTGEIVKENRLTGLSGELLEKVAQYARENHIPILVEADGSRRLPLKAPAAHEPPIPDWVDLVIVVAGLHGLGKPIDEAHVHRPELFAGSAKAAPGEMVSVEILANVLRDPQAGLKNIPTHARRIAFLNQADTEFLQSQAGRLAQLLQDDFDCIIVGMLSDEQNPIKSVFSPVAGIVLAAGKSSRMGRKSKVLLSWQDETFVHRVARTALEAGLQPVVVVTGASNRSVKKAVADLPVRVVFNPEWQAGQSTSLQCGVRELDPRTGAAIFLLADQPQVTEQIISALKEEYAHSADAIIAPMVEDRRANPVLFDRVTFEKILLLQGDTGGRAIFSQYPMHWLPWHDPLLLMDVDTPQDFEALKTAYEERYGTQSS
jgi:molybdenum cofactor cytidylyltransferase